jgi:DNA-binding transcriptional MerR regulator
MTDTRLTFKEMCAKFDVTPRTLRYYEYIELLSPEKEGRARFYGPREWLLIYGKKGERPQLEAWLKLADRQLEELDRQQAELEASLADLRALRDTAVQELAKLPAS